MASAKHHGVMPRPLLGDAETRTVGAALQRSLTDLIDLSLLLKQAHWTLVGPDFKSIHEQLDEILVDVRNGLDEIAERLAQIGVSPDGRTQVVSSSTRLPEYPGGFLASDKTVTAVADAMASAIGGLREGRAEVAEPDAITEDLLISIIGPLEKHLWMVQSREARA